MKTFSIALFACALNSSVAEARRAPMEAQNRVHVGGAWTPGGTNLGMGFDSRMTQAISIDVGGFLSPGEPGQVSEEDPYVLRHGLYVDPGIRIPHRNKGKLFWDIFVSSFTSGSLSMLCIYTIKHLTLSIKKIMRQKT